LGKGRGVGLVEEGVKEKLVLVEADSSMMVLGMVDPLPPFIGKVKSKSGTITS